MCDCAKTPYFKYRRACPCGHYDNYRVCEHDIVQPPCAKCGQKLPRVSEIAKCHCGSDAKIIEGWNCFSVSCNSGEVCWDGPAKPTRTEAVEAWNALMAPASPMQSGDGWSQAMEHRVDAKPAAVQVAFPFTSREAFDPTFTDTQTPPGFVEAFRKTFADSRAKPIAKWYRERLKGAPADKHLAWVAKFWNRTYSDIITDLVRLVRNKRYDTLDQIADASPHVCFADQDSLQAEARSEAMENAREMMRSCDRLIAGADDVVSVILPGLRRYNGTAPDIAWRPSPVRRWLARAAWFIAGAAVLAGAWVVATGKVLP